eukprot:g2688.t1
MKNADYIDTLHDEMREDSAIADSFYNDAVQGVEDFEKKLTGWKKTLDDGGFSELSTRVIRGELDIENEVEMLRRNLDNFKRTNALIRKRATHAQNKHLYADLVKKLQELCGEHRRLMDGAKVYQTKRIKALQKFQMKQMNDAEMIELENLSKLQGDLALDTKRKSSEMTSVIIASADAAAANMMSLLFQKSLVSSETAKDVDQIERMAGWDTSFTDLRFYTVQFADPYREREYGRIARREGIGRIRLLLILVNICNVFYTIKEWVNPFYDNGVDWNVQYLLLASSVVLFALLVASFLKGIVRYVDLLAACVFVYLSAFFCVFKIVRDHVGPMLLVQIMFVVLFQASKIRFHIVFIIGVVCFLTYFVTILISLPHVASTFDDVNHELLNYIITIAIGIQTAHKEERLHRRNYLISVDARVRKSHTSGVHESNPRDEEIDGSFEFTFTTDLENAKMDCISRHQMNNYTLSFRTTREEKQFMAGWYLIEDHPYSDFGIGHLHRGSFKVIAVSIGSVVLTSVLLAGTQDTTVFEGKEADMHIAWILRAAGVFIYLAVFVTMLINGLFVIESSVRAHETKSNEPFPFRYTIYSDFAMAVGGFVHLLILLYLIIFLLPGNSASNTVDLYFMAVINLLISVHSIGFKIRHFHATIVTSIFFVVFCVCVTVQGIPDNESYSSKTRQNHALEYVTIMLLTCIIGPLKSRLEERNRRVLFATKIDLMALNNAYRKLGTVVRAYISRKRLKKQLADWRRDTRGRVSASKSGESETSEHTAVTVAKTPHRESSSSIMYSAILGERMDAYGLGGVAKKPTKPHQIVRLWQTKHNESESDTEEEEEGDSKE